MSDLRVLEAQGRSYVVSAGEGSVLQRLAWVLFSFKGRVNRRTYFGTGLLVYVIIPAVYFVVAALLDSGFWTISRPINWSAGISSEAQPPAILVAVILAGWIGLATAVKRSHDFGSSGLIVILQFIPFVGFLAGLYILFARGTAGPNDYGAGAGWEHRPLS